MGKTLRELNVRAKYGVNVIALRSGEDAIKVSPGPDEPLTERDVLVILGGNDDLNRVQKL